MSPDYARLWPAVEPILDAVLDLPEPLRTARADELCSGNLELARVVGQLLRADRDSGAFLAVPPELFEVTQGLPVEGEADRAAERIGPFRITTELGAGGMGTVLLGERDDGQFEQKVAIKIFPTHGGSTSAREILVRERRILARLEHPHIARMYDGGVTETGDPYFIMEFVDGRPIDEHCVAAQLGQTERLRLFLDVCRAVAFAHRSLVVHCDLKPRNILVTRAGEVKVVDFGIARRLEEEGLGLASGVATHLTPAYAAPEQLRGEPVTSATDVYQLGLVLYELLSGRRARAEGEGPPKLIAVEPDLDAIVRKALRDEPGERYASLDSLADDVRRSLSHEPVTARVGSVVYRTGKFLRRHRGGVAAAGLIVVILLAGVFAVARQSKEARRQRDRKAQISNFLVSLFKVSDPSEARGKTITAREILDQGAARIDKELAGDPEQRAELMETIGNVYFSLGLYSRAEELLSKSLDVRKTLLGPDHPATLVCAMDLGSTYWQEGRYPDAVKLLEPTLETQRRVLGPEDPGTLRTMVTLANTYQYQGRNADAEKLLEAVVETQKRVLGPESLETLRSSNNLANAYHGGGKLKEAEKTYSDTLEIERRVLGTDHRDTLTCMQNLAIVYTREGRVQDAEKMYLQARDSATRLLGPEHPDTLSVLINLANLYIQEGRFADAVHLSKQTVASLTRVMGAEHPTTLTSRSGLAQAYMYAQNYQEAERVYRETLEASKRVLGPEHPDTLQESAALVSAFLAMDKNVDAETLGEETLRIQQRVLGPEHPDTLLTSLNLAEIYAREGRVAEAEKLGRDVVEAQRRVLGAQNFDTATGEFANGLIAAYGGKRDQALEWIRQAVAHGFRDADRMMKEESIKPLRSDREFQKLVALAREPAGR